MQRAITLLSRIRTGTLSRSMRLQSKERSNRAQSLWAHQINDLLPSKRSKKSLFVTVDTFASSSRFLATRVDNIIRNEEASNNLADERDSNQTLGDQLPEGPWLATLQAMAPNNFAADVLRASFRLTLLRHCPDKQLHEWTNVDFASWLVEKYFLPEQAPLLQSIRDNSALSISQIIPQIYNVNADNGLDPKLMNFLANQVVPQVARDMAFTNPGSELSQTYIRESVKACRQQTEEVIKLSADVQYQKTIFPYIEKPLPLSTINPSTWRTFHFNDLLNTNVMKKLNLILANSISGDIQKRRLNAMIQMSGMGKTHASIVAAKQMGGLVLRYTDGVHGKIFETAEKFIEANMYLMLGKDCRHTVSSFQAETKFLEYAKRTIMLIPLTFVEFAKYYAEELNIKPASANNANDAANFREHLIRATLNGTANIIHKMYGQNLNYIADDTKWKEFFAATCADAKELGISTIFYDEIARWEKKFEGYFIHDALLVPEGDRMVPMTDSQLLQRLLEERTQRETSFNDITIRKTSLLYVAILAMEEFVKHGSPIIQVTASTTYSITGYTDQKYSRHRLGWTIIPYGEGVKPEQVLKRFKQLMFQTYGKPILYMFNNQHHLTKLKHMAHRASFLWSMFEEVPKVPTENIKEYIDMWIERRHSANRRLALQYLKNVEVLHRHDSSWYLDLEKTMLNVTLLAKSNTATPFALSTLIHYGIIKSSETLNEAIQQGNEIVLEDDTDLADPYIREVWQKRSIQDLIEIWKFHIGDNIGDNGEMMCTLVMKYHAQMQRTLHQMAPEYLPQQSLYANLKLANSLAAMNAGAMSLKSCVEYFTRRVMLKNYILCKPPSSFGPDSVAILVDDQGSVAGFMAIQSKNFNKPLGGDKFCEAVQTLNPCNIFRSNPKEKAKWDKAIPQFSKLPWIRAIYSRGLTQPSKKLIQEHNAKCPTEPIIVLELNAELERLFSPMMLQKLGRPIISGRGQPKLQDLPKLSITFKMEVSNEQQKKSTKEESATGKSSLRTKRGAKANPPASATK